MPDLFWVTGKLGHLIGGSAAAAVASVPLNALASGMQNAVSSMLESLGTLWIKLNVPNVWDPSTGTSQVVTFMHTEVAPIAGFLAVLGIMIGGVRLAITQRAQPGIDLVQGLFILVLVTGCGVPVIGLLVSSADAMSQAIIDNATHGTDFSRNIGLMLQPSGALAPVLVVFFGIVALLVSVVQIILMVGRAALLVLMAGLLPVAAATTTTQTGREMMKKYAAWVIALTAYKPVAALIYAAAFRLIGTHQLDATGAGQVVIGLTLMIMAVLALPALMRFLVPATTALHAGGSGAATAATTMVMPRGARMIRHAGMMAGASGAVAARPSTPAPPLISTTGARSQAPTNVPGSVNGHDPNGRSDTTR